MVDVPHIVSGRVGPVDWTLRPEWLAGHYWWRVSVGGHPKLLMRDLDHAVRAAEVIAADELLHRQHASREREA